MIKEAVLSFSLSLAFIALPGLSQPNKVSVSYQIQSDWGAGFVANWYLTNNGTTSVDNWIFEFDQPIGSFQGNWNCVISGSSTATHKIFSGLSYNASIPAGGYVTFGYQGASGGLSAPANYILNGVPISGSGEQPVRIVTTPVSSEHRAGAVGRIWQHESSLFLRLEASPAP